MQGIDRLLRDALVADGWKVGFYTGEDKSGLEGFLEGDVDVLIGSSAIGTGVDGLRQVCNRLIVNVQPWTAAEFEQLKGRIYRQGQRRVNVTMILPLTYAKVHGESSLDRAQSLLVGVRYRILDERGHPAAYAVPTMTAMFT